MYNVPNGGGISFAEARTSTTRVEFVDSRIVNPNCFWDSDWWGKMAFLNVLASWEVYNSAFPCDVF